MTDTIRRAAVAGRFYERDSGRLRRSIEQLVGDANPDPQPATAVVVPHAGHMYSGACAACVFAQIAIPSVTVIIAPNHTGHASAGGGVGAWAAGSFATPLGEILIAEEFTSRLVERCELVRPDPLAHLREHAVEVELPFLQVLAPRSRIVPLVMAFDDWERCRTFATALAGVVTDSTEDVLLVASSDMTHYESADVAARKDRRVLSAVERLDGEAVLTICRRENVTMCGRAPTAVVCEASRQLGASRGRVVDYRHSGWVTGDDSSVVGYAGAIIS